MNLTDLIRSNRPESLDDHFKIPDVLLIPRRKSALHPKLDGEYYSKTVVQCQGQYNLTISQWLAQDQTNSSSICEPAFHTPIKQRVDLNKPVKVFILMGRSNMLGKGLISGKNKKMFQQSLEHAVKDKKRFLPLYNASAGEWSIYRNVRNVGVSTGSKGMHQSEWLGENKNVGRRINDLGFDPDVQFGYIMSQVLGDSPVMLLKSCMRSGESPERWNFGTKKTKSIDWHAGKQYDMDVANAKQILGNLSDYFPGVTHGNYEIAGFVWWQGEQDLHFPGGVRRYEENLVNMIDILRRDFHAPRAKFAITSIGFNGHEMKEDESEVLDAQLAVSGESGKYPSFKGNVQTVDIRSFWRNPEVIEKPVHYHRHAEIYLETGNALGWAMSNMLLRSQ
jgi:hypothetical protein